MMVTKNSNGAAAPFSSLTPTEPSEYLPDVNDAADLTVRYQAELERLASLNPLQYGQQREKAAEALKLRVSYLDKLVKAVNGASLDTGGQGRALEFPEIDPWEEEVTGQELLDEIVEVIQRFVVCNPSTAKAAALWVAYTWFIDVVRVSPIGLITAPEKRCGKSVMLNTIGKLAARPVLTSSITPAALFRVVELHQPTLLIDEADVVLKDNEGLRGILNSGHTRDTAMAIRTVGDDHQPRQFSTWGAKLIAGISANNLADTVTDRAIVLELRRKTSDEFTDRLRHAEPHLFETIKRKLSRWSGDCRNTVRDAVVNIPDELNDRAQDNWEPLLAIADVAGGHWPETARKAALSLGLKTDDSVGTEGTELLAAIRKIFASHQSERMFMGDLIAALWAEQEGRWSKYRFGQPMTTHQLGKQLKKYGIKSKTIREGARTDKGYDRVQFAQAFASYLPSVPKAEEVPLDTGDAGHSDTPF